MQKPGLKSGLFFVFLKNVDDVRSLMKILSDPENRRKAAGFVDVALCVGALELFFPSFGYFEFLFALVVMIILVEAFCVAACHQTPGLALFGLQVMFREPSTRYSASLKRLLLFCWHVFFVFWPEELLASDPSTSNQGLLLYKWESASATFLQYK